MRYAGMCSALLSSVAILAGCGGEAKVAGQGPTVEMDHSSARMLLVTLNEAIRKKDYNAIADSMTPDLRPSFKTIANAYRQYIQSLNSLADLVQKKIGADQAQRFRDRATAVYAGLVPPPLDGAEAGGDINWDKVKLLDEGYVTAVMVSDHPSGFDKLYVLQEIKGQWYIAPRFNKVPRDHWKKLYANDAKQEDKQMREFVRLTNDLRKKIAGGTINKNNFELQMSALSGQSPALPTDQPTSIPGK